MCRICVGGVAFDPFSVDLLRLVGQRRDGVQFLSLTCLDLFQKRPQVGRLDQIQTPRPVLRRHAEPVVLVADETAVLALREIERRRTAFFDREQAKSDDLVEDPRQFPTGFGAVNLRLVDRRSEEHTSELQSLMRISYAVFCLKKKKISRHNTQEINT